MKNKFIPPHTILIITILISMQPFAFGKIHYLKVPSVALSDSNLVIVSTPTTFDGSKRNGYPFIVMLHGHGGDQGQWESDADLQKLSNVYNVLLVLPDGGYDGWWVDTGMLQGRNYETHIHQEIKIWMVENFNGSPDPNQHGIMGLSMGGYGAFIQALKYPGSYGAAVSLSGVLDITRHPKSWGIDKALGSYSDYKKAWEKQNPLHLTQKVAPKNGPALLMICGKDDFAFEENQAIAHQMSRYGYPAEFREEPGSHSHSFWKTHAESAVQFIVSKF